MPYEAVLFDFDGVLMDSEPVHFACWQEALAPLGIQLDWETWASHCIGASEAATMEIFSRLHNPPLDLETVRARYPLKKEIFTRRMLENPRFAPGAVELVTSLAGCYKLAVVSSSSRTEVAPLLEASGMARHLGTIVCGEDVERHKPAPDPYLLAARRLGVRHALVVEDSEAGIESGRRAGFEVVEIPSAARTAELVMRAVGRPC